MVLLNDPDFFLQSSQPPTGTPDGNIFYDTTTLRVSFIPVSALASIDFGAADGSNKPTGINPNPLDGSDGFLTNALYSFTIEERNQDASLRGFLEILNAIDRLSGQYEYVNGWAPATDADRLQHRNGGWNERDINGAITRTYYNPVGIGSVDPGETAYYSLTPDISVVPTNAAFSGQINEPVRVDTSDRSYFQVRFREWQRTYTSSDLILIGNTEGTGPFQENHSLNTDVDTNVFETESNVATQATYTGVTVNYLPGVGFLPWSAGVTYAANAVVEGTDNRWYITTSGGTSAGNASNLAGGSDTGVAWVSYAGERNVGSVITPNFRPFNIIIANGGVEADYSVFYQRERWLLRQDTNINNNSANTGVIIGRRAEELLGYLLGAASDRAFGTTLGVFIDDLSSVDRNRIAVRDATNQLNTFPRTAPIVFTLDDTVRADPDLLVDLYFTSNNGANYPGASALLIQDVNNVDIVVDPFTGIVDRNAWAAGVTYAPNTAVRNITTNDGVWFVTATGGVSAGDSSDLAGGSDTGIAWAIYQAPASFSFDYDFDGNSQNGRTPGTNVDYTVVVTGRTKAVENTFVSVTPITSAGATITVSAQDQLNYRNQN